MAKNDCSFLFAAYASIDDAWAAVDLLAEAGIGACVCGNGPFTVELDSDSDESESPWGDDGHGQCRECGSPMGYNGLCFDCRGCY